MMYEETDQDRCKATGAAAQEIHFSMFSSSVNKHVVICLLYASSHTAFEVCIVIEFLISTAFKKTTGMTQKVYKVL